jgi:uroporphyrinogen-III synthase
VARVWVTRAQPGAEATAERLRALGHEPVVAPLIEVRLIPGAAVDLDGVGSIAFSSPNGVAAFAARSAVRELRAYAVGRATGEAARRAGFPSVVPGDADVAALARLIIDDERRPEGAVLHVCPSEPAGDLVGMLTGAGVEARRATLYETGGAAVLPEGVPALLASGALDCVLVHSPKGARTLAALARTAPALKAVQPYALSDACATPLRTAGFLPPRVAAFPREEALLSLVEK